MAPLYSTQLTSRACNSAVSNCSSSHLDRLAALVVLVFLAVFLGVYFYKVNKAKRLLREQNIPYKKSKILWEAFLAASFVGLIVLFAGQQSTGNGDSNATAQASGGESAGPSMGQQMQEENVAMNMNSMAQQPASMAAPDPIV